MTDKERAVIEAARNFVKADRDGYWASCEAFEVLQEALAALDADKPVIQKEASNGNP